MGNGGYVRLDVNACVVVVYAHPWLGVFGREACVWCGGPLHRCARTVAGFSLHDFAGEGLFGWVVGV